MRTMKTVIDKTLDTTKTDSARADKKSPKLMFGLKALHFPSARYVPTAGRKLLTALTLTVATMGMTLTAGTAQAAVADKYNASCGACHDSGALKAPKKVIQRRGKS